MTLESYFGFVWTLVMVYVLLGNYLYFAKILPALGKNGQRAAPVLLPSAQLKQVDQYVSLLSQTSEKPWFFWYLRHIRLVTLILLTLMLPLFIGVLRQA